MVNQAIADAAAAATQAAVGAVGLSGDRATAAAAVCDAVLWGVESIDSLEDRLVDWAKLSDDEAEALIEQLQHAALPAWQKLWEELDRHTRELNHDELQERFQEWAARLGDEVEVRRAELEASPNLPLALEEFLDDDDRWNGTSVVAYLAQRGRLVSVAMQVRDLREAFRTWAKQALGSDVVPPVPEQWAAPMFGLLLQYLVEVRLGWRGEEAALVASVIARYLVTATGDERMATVVYGDGGEGRFLWRPVRLENGQVVFAD